MKPDFERVVAKYITIRDRIKEIDDAHAANEERLELIADQNSLTEWFISEFERTGAKSVRTDAGTAYASVKYTASLADPGAFMDFIKATGNFDLLDRKANSTAVRDYVEANNNLPPGVNLSSKKTVGVRRSS